jgi:hypothetical protein
MKTKILLSLLILTKTIFCQLNVSQIDASLTSSGNIVKVIFTPNSSFINTGEASTLKVWLKMPAIQTSTTSITITNNPFDLGFISSGVSGSDRIFQYQVIFGTPFQYSTWSSGTPVEIAAFQINNYTGSALNVGLSTFNFTGTSWNGTSINRQVSGNYNNLVTWPINETTILPITLNDFSVTKAGERKAQLHWSTSSETNSAYFGIERSNSDKLSWETIATVAAAGNSSQELRYEYLDDKLPFSRSKNDIYYYRLRLTDQDGSYKYSPIKGVNFDRAQHDIISVYPNPASDLINVDISGLDAAQGIIRLRIHDSTGRHLLDKVIIGSGLEPIDVAHYPAGIYNISVSQGDQLHQKKFVVSF